MGGASPCMRPAEWMQRQPAFEDDSRRAARRPASNSMLLLVPVCMPNLECVFASGSCSVPALRRAALPQLRSW
eukprot:CAMPEP_0176193138 /NCGR_PEP_ID=MMETSP0121_2-20121125/5331_1 /TAXON_ID=160619 /ORGANISM="Kryptoperidinium foliaceum, Strain CCMP 1326" /LENGTH=72 /DNA_ID=CAMNT_0017531845 /DNA_START=26 /DNA_END=244 /DNA_ORIENTATION=-